MRFLIGFYLLLAFSFSASAQSLLSPAKTAVIPLGPNQNEIGIEKGEGEDWKPLFFSVDISGNIAIPDFYKGRIVLFTPEGKLIRGMQVSEGISPRMNYFGIAPSGGYVTYSDYTMYYLSAEGRVIWSHPFGIGAIPERIFPSATGIFALFPSISTSRQGTIVFAFSSSQPIGTYGLTSSGRTIPLVSSDGGKPFALKLGEMSAIPEYGPQGFQGPQNAVLQYISGDYTSLWSLRNEDGESFFLYSAKGALVSSGEIIFPEGETGSGFWTFIKSDLTIYKNYYKDDAISITSYRLR
jgi:hypothetical protein